MNRNVKSLMMKAGFYLLVAVIVIFAVFPFYYAILTAFEARTSWAGGRWAACWTLRRRGLTLACTSRRRISLGTRSTSMSASNGRRVTSCAQPTAP